MKMKDNTPRPQNVDDYIDVAPEASRRKLLEMRACVSKAAPGAEETLKYGMPAYCYQRILVIFGGFKNHIGFYPTGRAMKPFAKELAKFKQSRGSGAISAGPAAAAGADPQNRGRAGAAEHRRRRQMENGGKR